MVNVAVSWVLNEPQSPQALVVRQLLVSGKDQFIAPDIFPIEIAHALTRAERRGILLPPQGSLAFAAVLQVLPQLHDSRALVVRAFEISSSERVGVYDCLYLALAEREQVPLITADQRLLTLSFPVRALATF